MPATPLESIDDYALMNAGETPALPDQAIDIPFS
jgi:hypothetical protein